jgi:hypothetical protein
VRVRPTRVGTELAPEMLRGVILPAKTMLKRFTSGLMTAALFGALLGVVPFARDGGGDCPMARTGRTHDCCKRALSKGRANASPAARLCCLVNCPRPAPTGANFTFRTAADASTSPRPAATAQTPRLPQQTHSRDYSPPFQPSHSPPAYIQHAAFLI